MIDITHKSDTLRIAIAQAELRVGRVSVSAIKNNTVPKGDVFAAAKIAGLLAVKNTSNVLPHCHPIPVEYAKIDFEIKSKDTIRITVEVKTIYKTGCEMEALYGASVCALTIYDMLKPIDKDIEINNVKLLSKTGGKSDKRVYYDSLNVSASVIIISDSVSNKKSKDSSGKYLSEKLKSLKVEVRSIEFVPDNVDAIRNKINNCIKKKIRLIITTGGTGLSKRDITYEAVSPLIDQEITGVMETARRFGQRRTPYAMLSRGIAGFSKDTLILTFPGSFNAVKEYMDSLFPYVLHLFKVRENFRHDISQ